MWAHSEDYVRRERIYSMIWFFAVYLLTSGLTYLCLVSHKRDIGKQCSPRSDAAYAASDLVLHCLHQIQKFLYNISLNIFYFNSLTYAYNKDHIQLDKKNSLLCWFLSPTSILYKSIVGRYRPVSYPDGPITARYGFM